MITNQACVFIRFEEARDYDAVRALNEAVFGSAAEADLVDTLRREANPIVSLVAEGRGAIVGHILFTPVTLTGHNELNVMGLGPMAVAPGQQRRGIGSLLVTAGLEASKKLGAGAVVVLGHDGYYPRFGFVPAIRFGIHCEYAAPEGAFMVVELLPSYLGGATGLIVYHPAFRRL